MFATPLKRWVSENQIAAKGLSEGLVAADAELMYCRLQKTVRESIFDERQNFE
jgi:hypothetical protein